MDENGAHLLCGTPELPPGSVALTFDDGPGPRTAELARLLRDEGVTGTFFVLGESIERHGEALATLRECGHQIGLHADRHRQFVSVEQAAQELRRCAERAGAHLGETVWFRPPYGRGDWRIPGLEGPVGWHAQGRDWDVMYRRGRTVEDCVEAITRAIVARNGGIVLLHDYAAPSEFVPARLTEEDLDFRVVEITRLLIERLRAAGLTFVGLPASEQVAERPVEAAPARKPLGMAEDFQNLRLFRSAARAAGGSLDLLMPIRVGGEGPALFCAPPMVGLSWCYLALLPHVDARYPMYGLQSRGLRRPEPLPTSIQEMARDFADQIRTVQPHGPYHLLGWSLGGNVAFAIAEELESRGEEIGLLVILDSTLVDLESIESDEPWMIYNLVLAQFGYVPALTAAEPHPEARMLELVRKRPGLGLQEWPDQRIRALQRVITNNVSVALAYRPGRVRSPLLFFSASLNEPTLPEKLANWGMFVDGPIESVELDCHHRYMLLPEPIAKLGPALSERMARAGRAIPAAVV